MKRFALLSLTIGLLCAVPSAQNYLTIQGEVAEKLLRQSRNTLGGEGAVMSVTSLVMKGVSRVSAGDDGPPERAVEIRFLFPDQYLRIETAGGWVKRTGFSGNTLLTEIRNGATIDKPPAQAATPLLRAEKGRLARMLLGVASLSTPDVWLTLRQPPGAVEVGSAFETGSTTNSTGFRILEASAKDGFAARIFYDASGMPLRVEYEANRRKISIAFGDRRKIGALMLPHTITTTLDGMPLEELKLSEIAVNPALSKADFGG
ncbi:MAG: hypothetical protein M3R55_11765 [Acidobacteriota bacterium]|nr:hypothetical protein [Acidobacteriota bacterium]